MQKSLALFFLVFTVLASAKPKVVHRRYFTNDRDGNSYHLYVVEPSRPISMFTHEPILTDANYVSEEHIRYSRGLLQRVAAFIDADAKRRGHLNEITRPHHEREVARVRDGYWPTLILTTADAKEDILMTLNIAIGHTPGWQPPVVRRFAGNALGLPTDESFYSNPHVATDADDILYSCYRKYANSLIYVPDYTKFFTFYPWVTGESAELKFLVRSPKLRHNLVYLFYHAIEIQALHRASRIPLTEKLSAKQLEALQDSAYLRAQNTRLDQIIRTRTQKQVPESLRELHQQEADEWREKVKSAARWQSYHHNSYLYVQSSYPQPHMPQELTALSEFYIREFGFPNFPWFDFLEDKKSGTPGIRTQVFRIPTGTFESTMADALGRLGYPSDESKYYLMKAHRTEFEPDPCSWAVTL